MKIFYSKHANEKFSQESYVFKLGINKILIANTIKKSKLKDASRGEKITTITGIDNRPHLL